MANRFDRFRLEIENDESDENRNDYESDEISSETNDRNHVYNNITNTITNDNDSFDPSLSSVSNDGIDDFDDRKRRKRRNHHHHHHRIHDTFKVYANPFVNNINDKRKRKKKDKRKIRRRRNNNIADGNVPSTAVTVVIPSQTTGVSATSTTINQQTSNSTASGNNEWNPCSISEDVAVFKKYGVDPKYVEHDCDGCYGCNVQCDSVPIKQSNMKVLLEKIAQSGVNSGNVLARAETIRSNYLDLIVEPKRKLHRLLKGKSTTDNEREGTEIDNYVDEEECCDDMNRPYKSRRLDYNSSTKDLITTNTSHNRKNNIIGHHSCNDKHKKGVDDEIIKDEWNTLKIYNHLKHHQMNVIEQVQYRRTQLWNIMNEMDRNSIFMEHSTKTNVFGEKLRTVDPDQFKIYLLAHREWLALSKSRPDLMRPFYDPDKLNAQGTSNNREGEGNIINVSGQLLFGKKKR